MHQNLTHGVLTPLSTHEMAIVAGLAPTFRSPAGPEATVPVTCCGSCKTTSPTFLFGVLLLQLYSSLFILMAPIFRLLVPVEAGTRSRAHFHLFSMSFSCFSALSARLLFFNSFFLLFDLFAGLLHLGSTTPILAKLSFQQQSAPGNAPLVHLQLRPCQP
ncbi:hypothetical protein CEK26_006841 [Fusarium fujikuroi]|uniref:Uncharacterized protein n=1 Tax=Fusarium fujikuroi TaxID=5127 RepID=A0A5Q3D834_FUSFU|nr:hypothetical protein CEK27_006857 [Fusarium fujikuroi]QGI80057.1 hypothetical protein CEK25_006786 [Fusarium fujikuroi]QGI93772.1 hypothetical protein CEK26_006841 [Fusarium fujikuroi]VTT56437.1 unnamed protein product [Fusarium fujikuroi]VTT77532.1 unnamed protein product [Fusarium fujikuroi]